MDVVQLKQYIVNNNDKIKDILEQLGCHNIRDYTKEYRACTPDCQSNNCNVVINKENLSARIYTMGDTKQGDIISIVMNLNNLSFTNALKFSCKSLGLNYSNSFTLKQEKIELCSVFKDAIKKRNIVDVKDLPIGSLDMIPDYQPVLTRGWVNEGVTEECRKTFDIGYSNTHKGIIIPHRYWATGDIVGIMRRTVLPNYELFGIAKYLPLKAYPKGLNLYGLCENYKTIQESGQVVVYEAEKSVLKRYSRLDKTGVAVCCHELTPQQCAILIGLNVDIVISFDSDIPLKHIYATCDKLYRNRRVFYTFDTLGIMPTKSSIADLPNDQCKWFLENKFPYTEKEHKEYLSMCEGGN